MQHGELRFQTLFLLVPTRVVLCLKAQACLIINLSPFVSACVCLVLCLPVSRALVKARPTLNTSQDTTSSLALPCFALFSLTIATAINHLVLVKQLATQRCTGPDRALTRAALTHGHRI